MGFRAFLETRDHKTSIFDEKLHYKYKSYEYTSASDSKIESQINNVRI